MVSVPYSSSPDGFGVGRFSAMVSRGASRCFSEGFSEVIGKRNLLVYQAALPGATFLPNIEATVFIHETSAETTPLSTL
jgi:hypothetical protein